jgi:dihydroorotase
VVHQPHTVPPRLHRNEAAGVAATVVPFHGGVVLPSRLLAD